MLKTQERGSVNPRNTFSLRPRRFPPKIQLCQCPKSFAKTQHGAQLALEIVLGGFGKFCYADIMKIEGLKNCRPDEM
jgi:hypothetical protein